MGEAEKVYHLDIAVVDWRENALASPLSSSKQSGLEGLFENVTARKTFCVVAGEQVGQVRRLEMGNVD